MKIGMNPRKRFFSAVILLPLLAATVAAQHEKIDPLTPEQVNQIREAGIDPPGRILLYVKFLDEKNDKLKALAKRGQSIHRTHSLDQGFQEFTTLLDELASNLDQYSERKADLRPALKKLSSASEKWLATLRAIAGEPGFEVARKEAIESADDIAADAKRIQTEQDSYFAEHKDEKGQQRVEPK